MSYRKYVAFLEMASAEFEQVTHAPIGTIEDVKRFAPHLLPSMVKTVAFKLKAGPIVLVAARGGDRVAYKKVAAHFGVSRRKLRALSREDVSAELGVQPGCVAPIPLADNQQLLIDQAVLSLPVIHTGSGRLDVTLALAPATLVEATDGTVLEVTE